MAYVSGSVTCGTDYSSPGLITGLLTTIKDFKWDENVLILKSNRTLELSFTAKWYFVFHFKWKAISRLESTTNFC